MLFTLVFLFAVFFLAGLRRTLARRVLQRHGRERAECWTRQSINLGAAVLLILGLASIWFDDPTRLATALG